MGDRRHGSPAGRSLLARFAGPGVIVWGRPNRWTLAGLFPIVAGSAGCPSATTPDAAFIYFLEYPGPGLGHGMSIMPIVIGLYLNSAGVKAAFGATDPPPDA